MNYKDFSFFVFDWNGTLLDDVYFCYELLNKRLIEQGHKPVAFATYRDIFTFPIIEYYRRAGFVFEPGSPDNFEVLAKKFRVDYQAGFKRLSLFEDAIPFLEEAKKNKPLYLLSATRQDLLLIETKEKGIDGYFENLIGIQDIYGASKEAAGKAFFKKHELDASKALFIGDSLHDEEVAIAFEARCVLISKGHQSREVLLRGKKKEETLVMDSLSDLGKMLFFKD